MPPTTSRPIGRQLLDTLSDVTALIADTNDPDQVAELARQRQELSQQISALVDKNLDAGTKAYKDATVSLVAASESIRKAINGMEAVAKAIAAVGQALDLVGKLAAAV